ncbi:MAG: hypothetical protein B6U86_05395 [Candidatus Altiarchaeales archaeon ex4484_43]|nr:MAG: hypothetical protein B6U86_05395 [Candidatus Altiarchaeales archaeon ex4484_43]RLI89751.1 MAG: hypothetical protein DRO62_00950 [Candidatus Altiarchaeales archaeon]
MRMNKKLLAVVLFLFILAIGFLGFILLGETPEPGEYVKRISREHTEDLFFEKAIDRIPARGNITYPRVENRTIKVGVSTDPDELNFGAVPQNMTVRKFINLHNKDINVKVCVIPYGSIRQFIKIEQNNFIMKTNESREVMIEFSGDRIGSYNGELDVITKKPKYGFLEPLLPFVAC